MSSIEKRTVKASVIAGDSKDFELVGLAAAYNSLSADLGGFKEIIAPGAFKRALEKKTDVRCLVNHDNSQILGRTKSGTLTLSDSPEGLRFLCKLNPESEAHRNVYAAVKRGDLDQCSFAFQANSDKYENVIDATSGRTYSRRTLKDVDIFDVSVVTFPAYPNGTRVQARSLANYAPVLLADGPSDAAIWANLRAIHARQHMEVLKDFRNGGVLWEAMKDTAIDTQLRAEAERLGREIRRDQLRAEFAEFKQGV